MNNLIPEPRVNKNGVSVTKWVRSAPVSPSAALTAALPPLVTTPDPEASIGASILGEYGWIKVSDGIEMRNLNEFQEPEIARGSCWRVTNELIESVDFSDYGYGCNPDFANAVGSAEKDHVNIEHYAVFLSSDNTVIDFTVRQFDAELPFPLITTLDEWSGLMRKHLGSNVGLSVGELEYDDDDDDDEDDDDEWGEY